MSKAIVEKYDRWLMDGSPYAALVIQQALMPVQGVDGVIFPPTYLKPMGWDEEKRGEWLGYDISAR